MKKTQHVQHRRKGLFKIVLLCFLITGMAQGRAQIRFKPVDTLHSGYIQDIQAADLNRDGFPDLVTANNIDNPTLDIYYNDPSRPGKFKFPRKYFLPYTGESAMLKDIRIADLNKDQWPDIVVGQVNIDYFFVLLADGHGDFLSFQSYEVDRPVYGLDVKDFNNDSYPDIAFATISAIYISLQKKEAPGSFGQPSMVWDEYHGFGPGTLVSEDLNHDGYQDLIASSSNGRSRVAVLPGDAAFPGNFLKPVIYDAGNGNPGGFYHQAISFTHKGQLHIAVTEGDADHFAVLANSSTTPGTLLPAVQTRTIGNPLSIASGKLFHPENDQMEDIVTLCADSGMVSIYTQDQANGGYSRVQSLRVRSNADKVYVNDLNGDGYDDIAVIQIPYTFIYYSDYRSVKLTSPVQGEILEGFLPYTLRWTRFNTDSVRIRYFFDDQPGSTVIHEGRTTPGDSLRMFIPYNPGKTLYFEISTMDGAAKHIVSAKIQVDSLTVLSPNGGETLAPGSDITIRWKTNSQKIMGVTMITNNTNYYPVALELPAGATSVNWRVPADVKSPTQCRILVYWSVNNAFKDQSDADFTILPRIELVTPNGGERIYGGTNYAITWKNTHNKSYNAWYSTYNNNWTPLFTNLPSTVTSYNWQVPLSLTSTTCRIRIMATDSSMSDISDANFTVIAGVKVTAPNGGEVIQGGSTVNVSWTGGALTSFNGWFTTDNGATWSPLFTGLWSFQSPFKWTVPANIQSAQCRIRITSTSDSRVTDESDANFSIQGNAGARTAATAKTGSTAVSGLQLFPNPANHDLNLLLPNSATNRTLTVYNAQGVAVLKRTVHAGTAQVTIPVRSFSKGLYFVEMRTGASTYRKTFIKE